METQQTEVGKVFSAAENGSDFAAEYFSRQENAHFANLLKQLRTFEAAICRQIRHLDNRQSQSPPGAEKLAKFERELNELKVAEESDDFWCKEKILELERKLKRMEELITTVNMEKVGELVGKMQKMFSDLEDTQQHTLEILRERMELMERTVFPGIENWGEVIQDPEGADPEFEENTGSDEEIVEENEDYRIVKEKNKDVNCEIMVSDPFLQAGTPLGTYDGNPTQSFSRWAEKFQDILSLYNQNLTEPQKLSRLRYCLTGQAKAEFDAIHPNTLEQAINHLKGKFENENTKTIARQALSIVRQAPGEKVFEYANRLSEAVRTALAGENEDIIRKRLLEEFLDRLLPDIQFEVKSDRPKDYSNAYELAQHYELLLATKKSIQPVTVAELSAKIDALAIQRAENPPQRKYNNRPLCYCCRKPGHFARDCRQRLREDRDDEYDRNGRRDYGGKGYQRERYGENKGNWRDRMAKRDWRREEKQYRRSRTPSKDRYYHRSSDPSREREQRDRRSPTPHVQFKSKTKGYAPTRIASPILPLIAFLSVLTPSMGTKLAGKINPMICLPDVPSSLWKLPMDPICPNWTPYENPSPMELSIHRVNTLQYKTTATACECVGTKISRWVGLFGGTYEEINVRNVEVPSATCQKMKDAKMSPVGELKLKNGTFRATTNSLEVGWGLWPFSMGWTSTEVENCYLYDTVVFTRHGIEEVHTPTNECPGCHYSSGACRCPKLTILWKPDSTQQCLFIFVAKWAGEFSTDIWTADSNDFALTFANATEKEDCEGRKYVVSDQSFAIPKHEYLEMQNRRIEHNPPKREKRENSENSVGIVYSSQLAAQMTAVSYRVTQNTKRLFTETIKKVCNSLQTLADQTLTLAVANPTLLARYFLGNPYLNARLITEDMLEIKPCFAITELHFNWQRGHCFGKLPVSFALYGKERHGFLDPITQIIHTEAEGSDCEDAMPLYLSSQDQIQKFDQMNGEVKNVPSGSVHQLARYGRIDFPEISAPFFRNKIMANLTELYSPENFKETMETAKINQEILSLSSPTWTTPSEKTHILAGNIVSNGLFAFLKGGLLSFNQLWVFACCCYITFTVLIQFVLPPGMAQAMQYLGLGGTLANFAMNFVKARTRQTADPREVQVESVNVRPKFTPITQRWPSPRAGNRTQVARSIMGRSISQGPTRRNFPQNSELLVLTPNFYEKYDNPFLIEGKANGQRSALLMDTGAHMSVCGIRTAKNLGMKRLFPPEVDGVVGVGNKIIPSLGQIEVKMEIAHCTINTVILVADIETGKGVFDIIVGRKTLRKLPLWIDLETGSFIRKPENGFVYATESAKNGYDVLEKVIGKLGTTDEEIVVKFAECLKKHKNVFSKHEYDLGTCTFTAPTINTTTEEPPKARPYPVPEKYQRELKEHIDKMLKVGVIKESNTPWAHSIVLVKKTDGSLRPCVDFRTLNKVTVPDPYPIPRMDSAINRVAGKRWYSTLDLSAGFWQIPLDKESSFKCGVVTPWGLYQMIKLPFGLRNAPSIFQRTMDKILKGIPNITVYIDDIVIHTQTVEEHLEILEEIFRRLAHNGLKLKGEKCSFLRRKCTYLGHELSEEGYQPSLSNKEVIEKYPEPTNLKEVKRYLGLLSFFRKFIPNFATIASPLNKLMRGPNPEFIWNKEQCDAFEELKGHLLKAPCLRSPNYDLPFYLFTDASATAYGAALFQGEKKAEFHAVAYWSRTLNTTESKYPATHGELAAIVHAMNAFRPIIYGTELIILTDHRPLTFLFSKASINPKINRWLLAIQELEPKVIYIEGKINKVADAISRTAIKWGEAEAMIKREELPYLLAIENEIEFSKPSLESETKKDAVLNKVIVKIREQWTEPIEEAIIPYYKVRELLYMDAGIIRKHPQGQFVIPEKMKIKVLENIHRAHFGIVRCKAKARINFWWPNMAKDIENFVQECAICQRNAPNPPRNEPEYQWPKANLAWERIHIDLAGPIFNTNFLVVVDAYSKYPFVLQLTNTNSFTIISALRDLFAMFGSPNTLVSDNGRQFVSNEFENFLFREGTRHILSPTYHPSSNGQAERFVRIFKEGLTKQLEDGKDLKQGLFILLQDYRASPSPLSNESPAERFLKRGIHTSLDKIKVSLPINIQNRPEGEEGENQADNPPRARPKIVFEPGDTVWIREYGTRRKWSPGILLEPRGLRVWRVELEGGAERLAHCDQIKIRRIGRTPSVGVDGTGNIARGNAPNIAGEDTIQDSPGPSA